MTIKVNKFFIHSLFFVIFIGFSSPFLNQSWIFLFGIPIYAMFGAILLLLTPSIIYLKTSSINYIIGLIFVVCNIMTTIGGTPTIDNDFQYMVISSIIIFLAFLIILSFSNNYKIAPEKFGIQLSYNLFIFSIILIFLDFNGFWSNFINQSRMQTGGSILGYACFFGAVCIMLWRNFLFKKNITNFLIFSLLTAFILIFTKSKGPILVLFIICVLMTRDIRLKSALIILGAISAYIFSIFRPLYGDGSISTRLGHLKDQMQLIYENFFQFNLVYTEDFEFHIWILELFFKINVLSFFVIITLLYVFFNTRKSQYFRWIILYFSLIGLISFRLDDIIFSLSLCCAFALAEHSAFRLKQIKKTSLLI